MHPRKQIEFLFEPANEPPSRAHEVLLTDRIRLARSQLEKYPLLFLEGAPFSGKSTLLSQIVHSFPKDKIFIIEIRKPKISINLLLSQIESALGLKKSSSSKRLERIASVLERKRFILGIDNINQVQGARAFLISLMDKLFKARLIVTTDRTHFWDPSILSKWSVISTRPLRAIEVQNYLRSTLNEIGAESSQFGTAIQRTQESSFGNPGLLRVIVLEILKRGDFTRIEETIETAKSQFIKNLVERLDPYIQNTLLSASLIQHAPSLEAEIISELPAYTINSFESLGFLTAQRHLSRLLKEVARDLEAKASGPLIRNLRLKIIERCQKLQSSENLKEQVHHLKALQNWTEALPLIDRLISTLSREGQLDEIIKITEDCWKKVSAKSFERRRAAFFHCKMKEQALKETLFRYKNSKSSEDKRLFSRALGRMYFWRGELDKALAHIQMSKKLCRGDLKELFQSQLIEARIYKLIAPEKSFKLYRELLDKIAEANKEGHEYYAEALFEFGACAQGLGEYDLAIEVYELVMKLEGSTHSSICGMARFNRLDTLARKGAITKAKDELEKLRLDLSEARMSALAEYITQLNIRIFLYSGASKSAEAVWFSNFSLPSYIENLSNYDQVFSLFQIYCFSGNLMSASQVLQNLLKKSHINPTHYYGRLMTFFYAPLLKASHNASDLIQFVTDFSQQIPKALTRHDQSQAIYALLEVVWRKGIQLPEAVLLRLRHLSQTLSTTCFRTFSAMLINLLLLKQNPKSDVSRADLQDCQLWSEQSKLEIWKLRAQLAMIIQSMDEDIAIQTPQHLEGLRKICCQMESASTEASLIEEISLKKTIKRRELQGGEDFRQTILLINHSSREVSCNGKILNFQKRDGLFRLLVALSQHRNIFLSKEMISRLVWNENYNPFVHDSRIHTNTRRLRLSLEPFLGDKFLLASVDGYCLRSDLIIESI